MIMNPPLIRLFAQSRKLLDICGHLSGDLRPVHVRKSSYIPGPLQEDKQLRLSALLLQKGVTPVTEGKDLLRLVGLLRTVPVAAG